MHNGFTRIPNKILDMPWANNPMAVYLYTWLSLHADNDGKLTTSLRLLAKQTKLSLQQIRTVMGKLLATQVVTQDVTQGSTQVTTVLTISYLSSCSTEKSEGNTSCNTSVNTSSNTPRAYKNDNINISCLNEDKEDKENISSLRSEIKEKSSPFKKPTIDEVEKYISENGYTIDAEEFWYFYESKGWMIGKNKMKDWKAACRTWQRNNRRNAKDTRLLNNNVKGKYKDTSW